MHYVEMTAHACQTVHAPGVAWPKYVAPEKRGKAFNRHRPNKVKAQILGLLKHGSANSEEIQAEIGGPLATIQRNLYFMRISREVVAIKRKSKRGKLVNFYSMVAACNLH